MTFDPFGDFETQGYLRNHEKEKDLGSGLIDYSQKMTMAAMQIADMNV